MGKKKNRKTDENFVNIKSKKLRITILVPIVLLVLLVSVATGAVSSVTSYKETVNSIHELVDTNGKSYAMALERYFQDIKGEMAAIASSGMFTADRYTFEEKNRAITAVVSTREDISSMYIVGKDGIAINDSDLEWIGEDYSEEDFFQRGIEREGAFIDIPYFDEWENTVTMTVTYRVREDGFDGLICMDIKYDALRDIVNYDKQRQNGLTYCAPLVPGPFF